MASYIESTLSGDERIIYRGRRAPWSYLGMLMLGTVFLFVAGLGLLVFLYVWIDYRTSEMAITTKRVVSKTGLISRKVTEINVRRVESVQVDQDILGRLLGYGTIVISGAGSPQAKIQHIDNPIAFRAAALQQSEQSAAA